jgi:hypothetical protein
MGRKQEHWPYPKNIIPAVFAMFFSHERFARINAVSQEKAQLQRALNSAEVARGGRPHQGTPEGLRANSIENAQYVRQVTLNAFLVASIAVGLMLVIAALLGVVHFLLPWHLGKALQTVGGHFALWGTLLAVSPPAKSLGGESVPERVHGALFTIILATGGALAILGTLMSP